MEEDSPPTRSGVALRQGDRVQRAALAAQACETCRSRKVKCDELRPRCSNCTRLGVECNYREPKPTKLVVPLLA